MTDEKPIITLEDKTYNKKELDDKELGMVNKLAQIQQNKNNHLSQIADLDILEKVYLEELKKSLKAKEEEK